MHVQNGLKMAQNAKNGMFLATLSGNPEKKIFGQILVANIFPEILSYNTPLYDQRFGLPKNAAISPTKRVPPPINRRPP